MRGVLRNTLLALAFAAFAGTALAGMGMGSGSKRGYDRAPGGYPGYGGERRAQPCRGYGPCAQEGYRQGYGPGMGMGSRQGGPRQERYRYQPQYRYGQGMPGYAPRPPAAGDDAREDDDRPYRRNEPDYGRGGPYYRQGGGF